MPKRMIEQFAVNSTRDLAIRFVDTFHQGDETEKADACHAIMNMTYEMFVAEINRAEQCKILLRTMIEALEIGSWPSTKESGAHTAMQIGAKVQK